jgi:3-hydroxyacyl-[acyl-carrier-protein] dehydratase
VTAEGPRPPAASRGALPYAAPLRVFERVDVDRRDGALTLRAATRLDAAGPWLAAHFPGFPIFPGVFLVEGLRQAVAAALGERRGALPELTLLRSVRFLAPLVPGDVLALEASVTATAADRFEVDARCRRGDGVLAARIKAQLAYRGDDGA